MISMMPVKKAIGIIPIILMYLFGGGGTAAPASPAPGTPAPQPLYQWETMTAQNKFAAEDGTELMYYSYQLLTLSVANLEELRSGEAAEAERNVENFNSKMTALLEKAMEVGRVMQEDAAQLYKESGTAGLPFYDETSASCCRTGDLLSVRVSGCSYAGGAHPSRCDSGYLFIDPTQIADKPEEFRTGAAALLVEKAEALEEYQPGYWSDYADIIARWNEGTVLFDEEGMLAVYSPYLLGPYAMGEVELRLGYDELAELIGPGGLERLGVEMPS